MAEDLATELMNLLDKFILSHDNVQYGDVMMALEITQIKLIAAYGIEHIGHDSSIRELLKGTAESKIDILQKMGFDVDAKRSALK